ncbi:MAG: sodium:proline symporter, partial [Variovorax sp.]
MYLFVAVTGFVIYRYRQTRALTLAQFFEMRYSRRFRLFTGLLAFGAGIVNFGIIPCIGARFMVNFLELPQAIAIAGLATPTYLLVMATFLTISALVTAFGGQVAVLVSDCTDGMISQLFYVIVAIAILVLIGWSQSSAVLLDRPPGQSMVNPFDSFGLRDFNLWFVLMGLFTNVYGTMAWQNSHAFNASSSSPHESRMGAILGKWRLFASSVMVTLLAMAAVTYLHHPDFAAGAAEVNQSLAQIADPATRDQMRVPLTLSHMLPVGIKGMLCAIVLMGILSGDGIHLHSWGSILVQDVIVPLRKKPLTPRQHLNLLRCGVAFVAVFAFCFGALFTQTEKVAMWFSVTQAIYVGGAGAAIIGGLYWSRGTAAGAWAGLLTGSILSTGGIIWRQIDPASPLNGIE